MEVGGQNSSDVSMVCLFFFGSSSCEALQDALVNSGRMDCCQSEALIRKRTRRQHSAKTTEEDHEGFRLVKMP